MDSASDENSNFSTTRWSVVLEAAHSDPATAAAALERLCRRYWYPIYAFVRQRGHDVHEAEDLTQGFFHFVLERQALRSVDRQKGRFRTFMLTTLTNFLHNERDKKETLKRGGAHRIIPLDEELAESILARDAEIAEPPDRSFERRWAEMLVRRVLDTLSREYEQRGSGAVLAGLCPFLTGEPAAADYERLGESLSMEPGTLTTNRRVYGFGNAQQRFDGDDFLAALDFAEIFEIQVCQFRQLFLRQPRAIAVTADGITDYFSVRKNWFSLSKSRHVPARMAGE